ncbi:hypothetical protein E1B28_009126 [Marasmius oreades]|uniref:Uncharacterized protein n=1 Tax=Marasmius oreades TaxID=181124 RepID=A0A9P7UT31_9AGAR|nr:uncharacterized protein E1B28_009126 [Marasmius oreades]KAG7092810.1 hypothetical protein E1B28_009126 [Marasmius oreades]
MTGIDNPSQPLTIQQKELLVKQNSLSNNERQSRTRVSDLARTLFSKLAIIPKIKKIHEIKAKNEERRMKDLAFLQGDSPDPASPQASVWDLSTDEYQELVDSKERLEEAKPYLEGKVYKELLEEQKKMEPKASSDEGDQSRLYALDFEEVEYSSMDSPEIDFPTDLIISLNHNPRKSPPLGIFLPDNLKIIVRELASIKTKKVASILRSDKKATILDLDDLLSKLKIKPDDAFEGLPDAYDCIEAMDGLCRFEAIRDSKGEKGIHYMFMHAHCLYFKNKPDSKKYYKWWKPVELELRQKRFESMVKFSRQAYDDQWILMQAKADGEMAAEARWADLEAKMARFREDESRKRRSYPNRDDDSKDFRTRKPFRSGNGGGPSSDLHCIACSLRGHSAKTHSTSDPSPLWASLRSKMLYHPTSNKPLCGRFNIFGTSKGDRDGKCSDCKAEHVCSFCGRSEHYALSWKCQQKPSERR